MAPEPVLSDLVALGILEKPISEFTKDDIGTEVSIPYTDAGGVISGPIVFEVVGVNHHTNFRHRQTITLMSRDIIRYVAFDAKEPNNPDSNRAQYGNNRWSVSNIRQWLNSSGAANSWWTAQHEYDTAPTVENVDNSNSTYTAANGAYADVPGFLAGFSDDVLQHFTDITNITAIPTINGGGSEKTVDKVFLPSVTEMGFGKAFGNNGGDTGIAEGSYLSIRFPDDASRRKISAVSNTAAYWLRSPRVDYPCPVWYVNGGGSGWSSTLAHRVNVGLAPIIVLH